VSLRFMVILLDMVDGNFLPIYAIEQELYSFYFKHSHVTPPNWTICI